MGDTTPTVLLLGMGPTTLSALDGLADRFRIVAIVRNVRDGGVEPDAVAQRAHALGVEVISDTSPAAAHRLIAQRVPDCVVVSSYDRIIGSKTLGLTRFINVHYAPLPRYRGRANVNWAIINGEPDAGISIHVIAPGLDAGGILYQDRVAIGPDDTAADVYAGLNAVQRAVLADAVMRHLGGDDGEPQDDAAATYGCTRVPADGELDWSAPTERVYALVRALSMPYPPAHTYLGTRRVDVIRAAPLPDAPPFEGRIPGRIVSRDAGAGHVDVLTGDGILRIQMVAVDGAEPIAAAEVIRSTRETLGLRAVDLLARLQALEALVARLRARG